MKIYSLYLTYRNIRRLKEIVAVLFRYGFSHVLENTDLKKFIPFYSRMIAKHARRYVFGSVEVQLRMALEELGPTFVKFGQLLSRRSDILPDSFIAELSRLEDRVRGVEYEVVDRLLDDAYGGRRRELFAHIERQPVAAASLAQVHRASLAGGGDVVLKIKRPGIEESIRNDFVILQFLGSFFQKYFADFRHLRIPEMIEEFGRSIGRELDFRTEVGNIERMRAVFDGAAEIVIPRVYPDISSRDVIVMEHIESRKFTDIGRSAPGEDMGRTLLAGLELFVDRAFEAGVFHGDLHPGNVGMTADGRIVLYDFGNIGFLTRRTRELTARMLISLLTRKYDDFIETLFEFDLVHEDTNLSLLERDLMDALEFRAALTMRQLDVAGLIVDVLGIARRHRIAVPVELVGFFRTVLLMDSIGKSCIPDFSLHEILTRVVEAKMKERSTVGDMLSGALKGAGDLRKLAARFPGRVDKLLKKMITDRFTVDFVHMNLETLIDEMKKSSNRLSVSMIVSSLIIGSSVVFFSDKGPHVLGYPLLGVLGFLSSAILALYLLVGIIRAGRL